MVRHGSIRKGEPKMKLWEIGQAFEALEQLLDEIDVSVEGVEKMTEAQANMTKWFDELSTDESNKIDAYRSLIRKWDSEIAVAQSVIDQYAKIKKSRQGGIDWLKSLMLSYLQARGKDKIITDTLGEV